MAKKVKKVRKRRGSKTHGWGAMKKHRGAGSRGGRGRAGTGKRAHTKKITMLKEHGPKYMGKKGFKRPQRTKKLSKTINIEELNKFKEEKIDLTKLGYTKLLGKGKPNKKYEIKVKSFSKIAKNKIEKAGGKIN